MSSSKSPASLSRIDGIITNFSAIFFWKISITKSKPFEVKTDETSKSPPWSSDRPLLYFPDGENEGSAQGRLEKGASLYQRAAKEEETAEEVGRSREVLWGPHS